MEDNDEKSKILVGVYGDSGNDAGRMYTIGINGA